MPETTLDISWPDEEDAPPDPFAEQKAYFAKFELERQQKIIEQRSNNQGLSVYERSRIRPVR